MRKRSVIMMLSVVMLLTFAIVPGYSLAGCNQKVELRRLFSDLRQKGFTIIYPSIRDIEGDECGGDSGGVAPDFVLEYDLSWWPEDNINPDKVRIWSNDNEVLKAENYEVIEKIELIAKFIRSAKDIFENGGPETKKEVLSILSSNIALKDKKVACFGLSEPFNWLYQDMVDLACSKPTFEPSFFGLGKQKTAPQKEAVHVVRGRPDSLRTFELSCLKDFCIEKSEVLISESRFFNCNVSSFCFCC